MPVLMQRMTRLMALATVMIPLAAHAADWDTDTARILGDPAFLPLAGQVSGEFSYSYEAQTYNYVNIANGGSDSVDRSSNTFSPSLSYGITDDISVSANLDWGNSRLTENRIIEELLPGGPGGGPGVHYGPYHFKETYHSQGAFNPAFGATWRVIDERSAPVNVDISVSYAPDVFTARDAEYDSNGSLALGGQRGTAEIAVSREWQVFTARGYALLGVDGERKIDLNYAGVPQGTYVTHTDARPDYEIGLQTQTRPLPFLAVNAGVSVSGASDYDEYESYPGGSNPNSEEKPGFTVSPYVGLLTPLLSNRIVGEILYQHNFNSDDKVLFPDGSTGKYSENQSNVYTASIRFLLF